MYVCICVSVVTDFGVVQLRKKPRFDTVKLDSKLIVKFTNLIPLFAFNTEKLYKKH